MCDLLRCEPSSAEPFQIWQPNFHLRSADANELLLLRGAKETHRRIYHQQRRKRKGWRFCVGKNTVVQSSSFRLIAHSENLCVDFFCPRIVSALSTTLQKSSEIVQKLILRTCTTIIVVEAFVHSLPYFLKGRIGKPPASCSLLLNAM